MVASSKDWKQGRTYLSSSVRTKITSEQPSPLSSLPQEVTCFPWVRNAVCHFKHWNPFSPQTQWPQQLQQSQSNAFTNYLVCWDDYTLSHREKHLILTFNSCMLVFACIPVLQILLPLCYFSTTFQTIYHAVFLHFISILSRLQNISTEATSSHLLTVFHYNCLNSGGSHLYFLLFISSALRCGFSSESINRKEFYVTRCFSN